MKVGLIGLPTVGKTTFFNLLTNQKLETNAFQSGKIEANIGLARVPDQRVDFLTDHHRPKKTTYTQIEVIDVPGLISGSKEAIGSGNQFLNNVRQVDCLVHIVRAFEDDQIMHVEGSIDVIRDIENIKTELLLADLQMVESRIDRIETGKKVTKDQVAEKEVLNILLSHLENEGTFANIDLTDDQRQTVEHLDFLTDKPVVIVVNVDDGQLVSGFDAQDEIMAHCQNNGYPIFAISAKAEMEISELDPEDRALFLEELNIERSGVDVLAETVYQHLGLVSFLTAGEDEVRAWTIKAGINARAAAGKIHSDIERGFIRAEVISFDDFKEAGNIAKARELGKLRLEGKEYIMKDGDIVNFRFNV